MTRNEKGRPLGHEKSKNVSSAERSELEATEASSTGYRSTQLPASTPRNNLDNMGMLAQRLGSEQSWAESFVPSTPSGTVMTPTESSAGDDQDQSLPHAQRHQGYPDEPPPSYSAHELPASTPQEAEVGLSSLCPPSDLESSSFATRSEIRPPGRHPRCDKNTNPALSERKRCRKPKRCLKAVFSIGVAIFLCLLLSGRQLFNKNFTDPPISVPTSSFVPSRNIVQRETTRSITGTYSVYDVLDLSTVTGTISITLEGRPGAQPAMIKLASKTGSINVQYASSWLRYDDRTAEVLDREFHTTITTKTGSINAKSLLLSNGGSTMIETVTGSINADIYLIGSESQNKKNTSRLDTRSKMGTQYIEVQTVKGVNDRAALSALRAEHRSLATASVNVKYPRVWEGVVHASCGGTGSVNVKGEGLEYQNQGSRDVLAWRGEVHSNNPTVEVRSDGTGSIKFKC